MRPTRRMPPTRRMRPMRRTRRMRLMRSLQTTRCNLGGLSILRMWGASNDSLGVGRFVGCCGEGNTFVGYEAGASGFPEAQNNTFVGKNAGEFPIFHGSGNTLLGADTKLGSSA